MKVGVIGSRGLTVDNLEQYLPEDTTEIVSGGAKGIDTCAREYALSHDIKLTEFLPEYSRYGRGAPLKRNLQIIIYSDLESKGTKNVIENCKKLNVKVDVHIIE